MHSIHTCISCPVSLACPLSLLCVPNALEKKDEPRCLVLDRALLSRLVLCAPLLFSNLLFYFFFSCTSCWSTLLERTTTQYLQAESILLGLTHKHAEHFQGSGYFASTTFDVCEADACFLRGAASVGLQCARQACAAGGRWKAGGVGESD